MRNEKNLSIQNSISENVTYNACVLINDLRMLFNLIHSY